MATQQQIQSNPKRSQSIEPLLGERDIATILGLSLATIRRWRVLEKGPPFLKLGASVRYRREDFHDWVEKHIRGGEANLEVAQ